MAHIRVVAKGSSTGAQSNARGHLFEQLVASTLKSLGYEVNPRPSVVYAGMEIDIEGCEVLSRVPVYAECKCYETPVDSPKFQAFYGKYMARWRRDHRCRGLFVALPGVNSSARGFYKDNCENATDITVTLLEEDAVISALARAGMTVAPEVLKNNVPTQVGTPGDQVLLYTEHGILWLQYTVSSGGAIADGYMLFNSQGRAISDVPTVEYIQEVCPDLAGFQAVPAHPSETPLMVSKGTPLDTDIDQIVEVRGSSAWFEYQFPASPEFFVGRFDLLREAALFAEAVLDKSTSARGLLFSGNSGWGKSSAVLATAESLRTKGHTAVVIDCRSISSTRSVLRVVEFAAERICRPVGDLFRPELPTITGFDGALEVLRRISSELRQERRLAFIFFDQFENVFFMPEALKRIRDLLSKICDEELNVVLGFAWKTDLIGATNEFPFQERDAIADMSRKISLEPFSDVETNALLDKLKTELRTEIRKDLRFFLSEFSQGFPWLLKKLCAHVKAQREIGVAQAEMANRLLNIEQLFKDDLQGLTPEQEDTLRRIAKVAPVGISDLSEHYSAKILRSLVDARLVVRIGNKYDIYWDIFRDYLNYDRVPTEDNYLLRMQIGAILNAMRALSSAAGQLDFTSFREATNLSEHSAFNVIRDLRLLGLASTDGGRVKASIETEANLDDAELMRRIRVHIKNQLMRNRLVSRILADLKAERSVALSALGKKLSAWCPYITATAETWRMYARVLAAWLDLADLATYNRRSAALAYYEPSTQFRERDLNVRSIRRAGLPMPGIQYSPVERIAFCLAQSLQGERVNWNQFKMSTMQKALGTLEAMQLIKATDGGYRVAVDFIAVGMTADQVRDVFAAAITRMDAFRQFIKLLQKHSTTGCSQLELGRQLRDSLGVEWKDGTATTNVKIMLDWARHTETAPGVFARHPRKKVAIAVTCPPSLVQG